MTKLVMEAGTDVAETVLFSVDEIPDEFVSEEKLADLEARNLAIRMRSGSDGGYLLHLFIDEEAPEQTKRYCSLDDTIQSEFRAASGRIAFGGAETATRDFEPCPGMRTDKDIPPGRYDAVAYRTEFPDDVIESAIESVIGKKGRKVVEFPGKIIVITLIALILPVIHGFAISANGFALAAAILVGGILWFRTYTRSERFKDYEARQREIEYEFPSAVVEMVVKK